MTTTAPGTVTPSGSVRFYDGDPSAAGVLLGSAPLNGLGVATLSTSGLAAGAAPHSIIAVFVPAVGTLNGSDTSATPIDVTVGKATLTVQADDQLREYGDANPALTATFTGFQNGETFATSGVTGAADIGTLGRAKQPRRGLALRDHGFARHAAVEQLRLHVRRW